jgi:hypothetical protein
MPPTTSVSKIPEGFNNAGSAPMVRRVGLGDLYACSPAPEDHISFGKTLPPERGLPANRG